MTNPDAALVRASAEYMDDAAAFLLPRHQTYTAEQLTHLAARLRSLADRLEGAGDVGEWLNRRADSFADNAWMEYSRERVALRQASSAWDREHQGKEAGE